MEMRNTLGVHFHEAILQTYKLIDQLALKVEFAYHLLGLVSVVHNLLSWQADTVVTQHQHLRQEVKV